MNIEKQIKLDEAQEWNYVEWGRENPLKQREKKKNREKTKEM